MKRGDIAFLDTNILLAMTDLGRPSHAAAVSAFEGLYDQGVHPAINGQVAREYLVVATRPVDRNGLGMTTADALDNLETFRARTIFLEETEDVADELAALLRARSIAGKRIHDANILATMRRHEVRILLTLNPSDFSGAEDIHLHVPQ